MSGAVLVLTTLPAGTDAAAWARPLVDGRLAACVSVLPEMTSVYRWRETVEVDREQQLVIKTTEARLAEVRAWVAGAHPYEVPELLVLPVAEGGEAYLAWLRASVTS